MRRKTSFKKRVSPSVGHAYRMNGKLKKGQEFWDWLELLRDKSTPFEEEVARIHSGQRIRGHVI